MKNRQKESQDYLDTAVIMAGGMGTRLSAITGILPKAMVNIRGTGAQNNGTAKDTILEHQIKLLHENGVTNFIIVVGNKREYIQSAFTNEIINNNLGCNDISLKYFEEISPLGTAGAFCSKELQDMIGKKSFLFTYSDVLFDVNVQEMYRFYRENNADAAVLISPCAEPDDRPLCVLKPGSSEITGLISKQGKTDGPRGGFFSNTPKNGLMILNDSFFKVLPDIPTYLDMEDNVLAPLIYSRDYNVVGWNTPCYIKDIGTIDRFYEGTKELELGLPQAKNPSKFPQSCAILKASDIVQFDDNGVASANNQVASAVSVLNKGGVITLIHNDFPRESVVPADKACDSSIVGFLQDKIVDTLLVRSAGAYPNAKVNTPQEFVKTVEGWNVSPENCYCLEQCDDGCKITKLSNQETSFTASNFMTTAHAIVSRHVEMQQAFAQLQTQNANFATQQFSSMPFSGSFDGCQ